MRIDRIASCLGARILISEGSDSCNIDHVYAGDRMSDLLGAVSENIMIVTHLSNQGLVSLIELMDASAICLLNGVSPQKEVIDAAMNSKTPLIISPFEMYDTCGVLYEQLRGERIR